MDKNNSINNHYSRASSEMMINNSNGTLFSNPPHNNRLVGFFNNANFNGPYEALTVTKSGNNNNKDMMHEENTCDVVKNNKACNLVNKMMPPPNSVPMNEDDVGGYIFVCNNETMGENFQKQLFGLPSKYRNSIRAIHPGMPLFLYNYSTHQLHGIFEAASYGRNNIDPTAWKNRNYPGESRFPAQVQVITRKACDPLPQDVFRPVLHHYSGTRFRLRLTKHEADSLISLYVDDMTFKEAFKATPA
ncbi:hypothetical protein RIF29_26951 [Crotalaria pallida]|uniref:DCD domain-containing protein n=1 Tax=Crotalaria pallida TaxID=3830 RepID=A0AAN9I0M2_CROPI